MHTGHSSSYRKDIIYRNNAADIKMIVCVGEDEVIKHVEESLEQSPTVMAKALIGRDKEGWYNFNKKSKRIFTF